MSSERRLPEPPSSEVTPESVYRRRREFLKNAGLFAATATGVGGALYLLGGRGVPGELAEAPGTGPDAGLADGGVDPDALPISSRQALAGGEEATRYRDVTRYNNFYELGTDKSDPVRNAGSLRPRPWTLTVEGETHQPRTIDLDTVLSWFPLEERIYRMRCVEAWSMVIPWVGFPLAALVKRLQPTSRAKYVAFTTLYDPEQLPAQRRRLLPWPYVEGLRMDEAMNPLTLMAVGLYGKVLPNQNGAPIRLVVPWKYGFKGIKSIVKLAFTETEPPSTWNVAQPREYGFYANVNPEVDHPRWSQATEHRIGELGRRPTLMFNGYAEQVAHLYAGMDLRRSF